MLSCFPFRSPQYREHIAMCRKGPAQVLKAGEVPRHTASVGKLRDLPLVDINQKGREGGRDGGTHLGVDYRSLLGA